MGFKTYVHPTYFWGYTCLACSPTFSPFLFALAQPEAQHKAASTSQVWLVLSAIWCYVPYVETCFSVQVALKMPQAITATVGYIYALCCFIRIFEHPLFDFPTIYVQNFLCGFFFLLRKARQIVTFTDQYQ